MLDYDLNLDFRCPHCDQWNRLDLKEREEFKTMRKGGRWVHLRTKCQSCSQRISVWFDCKHEVGYISFKYNVGKPNVR